MPKHAPIPLATTLATVLLVTGVVAASTATAGERTVRVRETIVRSHVDDVGKKGPSLGDRLLFVSKLRSGTAAAGEGVGDCTWYSGRSEGTARYYCTVVYRLRGGQLVITGLFSYARTVNTFAITGGTGRFRDSTGQAVARTVSADTFEVTFHLDR